MDIYICLLQVNSNHILGAQRLYEAVFDLFWPQGGKNKIFINIYVIISLCQRKVPKFVLCEVSPLTSALP